MTLLSLMFGACGSTKNLKANEYLLTKNKIDLVKVPFGERVSLKQELQTLFKQIPNTKYLFFLRREGIYQYLENRKTKKVPFRKTLSKQAEPPTILDTFQIVATESNMKNYLFNQGYFDAEVSHKKKLRSRKRATIKYIVKPNEKKLVDSLLYISSDSTILNLLNKNKQASLLKPGSPIALYLFQNEKIRISELMQNNGYAEFNPNMVDNLKLDTSINTNILKIRILEPNDKIQHNRYFVGKVNIITNFNPQEKRIFTRTNIDSISITQTGEASFIRNEVLLDKIHPRPGQLYKKENIDNSYLDLAGLNFYKFINIESKTDSINPNLINHTILLSPHKKWAQDYGADLNYNTLSATAPSLFGVSGFYYLKNRNAFKGAEVFDFKLDANVEFNFFEVNIFNSVILSYLNSLTLATFKDVTGSYFIAKQILKPFSLLQKRPRSNTVFNLLADYTSQTNAFSFVSFNSAIKYDFNISKRKRLSLNTFEVNYYLPSIFPAFEERFGADSFVIRSLKGDRLFSSFFFSRVQYFYQAKKLRNWDHTSIYTLELSGLEADLIGRTARLFVKDLNLDKLGNTEFSKFIKMEIDARWYYRLSTKSNIAFRGSGGIAIPYSGTKNIPYIKQFFLGGPQNMRGWGIREPGPGSSDLSQTVTQRGNFFSTGDIKLEANVEWRFDLVWIFKGAVFVDAGNVWLLPTKENPANTHFTKDFYNQMGIGTGIGLRMDLSFFILRLDWGFKLRNTFPDDQGKHWINYTKGTGTFGQIIDKSNLHLALNYPF
ncbi:MAG: BamA/TamA family outer membrane protein [Saprospiraceae bacterium]|nr:BamA/TamA family outer membrane protein [Saprospiraceae bacterium]